MTASLNPSIVAWIHSAAVPLVTVHAGRNFDDLDALRPIIGDARVVSLGEATHGTREFFQLKHRLLEFCVAQLGFTMLGIEADFPESLAVNAYVLDGLGNAAEALAGLRIWPWQTEELLALIEWMRGWNSTNRRKVKFYGFDMAYPSVAALGLIDYLGRVAPELAGACAVELAPLTSDLTSAMFEQVADVRRHVVFACIAQVLAAFEQQRSHWIATTSAIDWHLARQNAIVLDQGARFQLERGSAFRDRAMAENVWTLLEAEGPDARAVLWSHNDHAARYSGAMGKHLDTMVGRAQVVVGFSFGRGSFRALAYPTGELTDHTVTGPLPDSFDDCLAQAELPLFALDVLNAPREGPVAAWLASELPMRAIGGLYGLPQDNAYAVTYTRTVIPRAHFDVIVFVAGTTASRPNRRSSQAGASIALAAPSNLELSGDGFPTAWENVGAGRRHAHAIAASEERSPSGMRTVCISRDAAPWRWGDGQLIQKIAAEAWRGKRLRFAAAVRTDAKGAGTGALIFLRFLAKPKSYEAEFFVDRLATIGSTAQPVQSSRWANLVVEADVPDAADCFILGLAVTGTSAAWFGDLEVAAIGSSR